MRSDEPGFPNQIPGFAPRCSHDYGSAPGSPGITAAMDAPPLASIGVAVANLPDSPLTMPRELSTVSVGDTFSSSADLAVHDVPPFLAGGRVGNAPDRTGAGDGGAGAHRHPNSAGAGG